MRAIGNLKTCITCKQTKPLTEYNKDSRTADGLECRCRECAKERSRKYRETHAEIFRTANKRWREENSESIKSYQKEYREKNRERINQRKAEYRLSHKEKIKEYREAHKEDARKWRQEHREEIAEYQREWRSNNREKIWAYFQKKRKTDDQYRISVNYRRRIGLILRSGQMSQRMKELLGCDFETLKTYIEKQFKPGMTWDNYGTEGWQIDHIKPCAAFDMTNPQQVAECFNYKNMQPLWRWENQEKSDKLQNGTLGRRTWQSK